MAETLTIQDCLRGCSAVRMQTVGMMQVIPLVSDLEDERFASPAEVRMGTVSYGTMKFRNPTDKVMLVPTNATYMTKHKAQDHAMTHAGFLNKQAVKQYDTACCVQQTQGNYIPEDQHKLSILPLALREKAFETRKERSMGRLWESITKLKRETGVTGGTSGGHLIDFFEHFDRQLDQFVAEFELVPNQVGAIILLGGEVVGVERAPNRAYWRDLWEPLIRSCYGAEAIRRVKTGKAVNPRTAQVRAVANLDDLALALREARDADDEDARSKVRSMVQDGFEVSLEENQSPFTLVSVKNPQFIGQIVREGPQVHYISVVARESFAKHSKWHQAAEFKM